MGLCATVGWPASEHLIHHDPQAIDVCADIYLTILDLFWRHVQGCAEQRPGPGETSHSITHCRGKAKVNDFDHPSVADQHIWVASGHGE